MEAHTKKSTLRDVAQLAGVTPAVISRVFNRDPTLNIKDETRQAVLAAIEKLNYQPNSIARSLRTGSTNAVGVIISDIMNPFVAEIVKGIQTATDQYGYNIILCDAGDSPKRERQSIETLNALSVEGIILGSGYLAPDVAQLLDAYGIRYVMLNRASSGSAAPYVGSDDTAGMMEAVKHVVSLGHSRIAHVTGPLHVDTAIRRLEGYRKALFEAQIPFVPEYVVESNYEEPGGYAACQKLFRECALPPTALCMGNDMMAIGALRFLQEQGIPVPERVSVVGYNDIWVAPLLSPPLTTVHMPLMDLGKLAFDMLKSLVDGRALPESNVRLKTSLIVRGSTGPCPSR